MARNIAEQIDVLRSALRVHQWAKNLLIAVPVVLGGKASDAHVWQQIVLGIIALCCVASANYLVNDICDLANDRKHWSKKLRPLASGQLSVRTAGLLAAGSLAAGGLLTIYLGLAAFVALLIYIGVTTAYSLWIKRIPILDVFTLACLFTFRIAFGILLSGVRLSPWLLAFSMFVFLSLSLAKRNTELLGLARVARSEQLGRGYVVEDTALVLAFGVTAALAAVLTFIFYLVEDALPKGVYAYPTVLWAGPPILFLFLARLWLLSQRGQMRDDPVAFALKDWPSLLLGLLLSAVFFVALY